MKFEFKPIGNFFRLQKGLGYLGKHLSDSTTGLVGLNSFLPGGGYKYGGEKPYSGPYKPEHEALPGDLFIATTDITQDGRVLASPFLLPDKVANFEKMIFSGDIVKAVQINEGLLPEFLFNILRVQKFRIQAAYASTGTTVRRIPSDFVESISIPVPPVALQRVINSCLRSVDQKIHMNVQLSKTLEDIAQTIFKSWFIDFDPVKAKMAGENPVGMDAATAALFPEAVEDLELGLIPKGWSWGAIGDIADVIDCLHSKKPELLEVGLPYLQLDTISDNGVLKFDKAGKISGADYDKWTARIEVAGGDCLITNVGRVGAVSQVPNHFKSAIGRNITAMRPKRSNLHQTFLLAALTSDFMAREITRSTDSGTILEALNVRSIPKLPIPMPSDELLAAFETVAGPMWLQIHELYRQSVMSANLRDSLLPRLTSGELQIPEEMLVS